MTQVPRTEESARHWARQAAPLQIGRVGAVLELPSTQKQLSFAVYHTYAQGRLTIQLAPVMPAQAGIHREFEQQ
jgi:hypothetical protein